MVQPRLGSTQEVTDSRAQRMCVITEVGLSDRGRE